MEELKRLALHYIETHNTMVLATSLNDVPWSAPLFYANKGFDLFFISNPEICLHCKHIAQNPKVAVTISENYKIRRLGDIRRIKGIQLEAEARMVEDEEELNEAIRVYKKRYPFTSLYLKSLFGIEGLSFFEKLLLRVKKSSFSASRENRFYRIRPIRLFIVDNERSFERRLEVPL